ncbi:class I SAM-dependent methyltransferase [Flocculibacter collagenilyticus]|uniref:class I SAM-dependent methyltransferase n=1 Tax=Flocculibacter collagenilyticus TaxID=2744479 RepID=UPI0018F6DD25|nr:class I SAM-dependent methyltransferase [Flocculibacter collagenilyticus]
MYINPNWRVLTVGDGDLSFSLALSQQQLCRELVASIYDNPDQLIEKYGEDQHLSALHKQNVSVLTAFDVTNEACWHRLDNTKFDLVIFQFPLLPGFTSKQAYQSQCNKLDVNTLNRRLLRTFLINAERFALDRHGAQLCYITSKDVKPYNEWDIERSIAQKTAMKYVGLMAFDASQFIGYQVRNVDRNKYVKDTSGKTYVWTRESNQQLEPSLQLTITSSQKRELMVDEHNSDSCIICNAGPFQSAKDKQAHLNTNKHSRLQRFDQLWRMELACSDLDGSEEGEGC